MLSLHAATLLVIEPDQAAQADLRATSAADGHPTIPAFPIAPGIAALAAFAVDLILVDGSGVPDPDGWAALARLRAAAGAVPFGGYRARGFAGLVAKPGDADDLGTAIAPLLAAGGPASAAVSA